MTNPTWFIEQDYLESKLAKLKALNPSEYGDWTTAQVREAIEGAGFTLFGHFEIYNGVEGTSPNQYFNAYEYIEAKVRQLNEIEYDGRTDWGHDEVAGALQSVGGAWSHFFSIGYKEGVNPSNAFSLAGYYANKAEELGGDWTAADVEAYFIDNGVNALVHYYAHGIEEGIAVAPVPEDEQVAPDPDNVDPGPGPGPEPIPGETFRLKVDADDITGTDGDDTFIANVSQNPMGQQVNTLGSGDYINGGKGYDTLSAKITAGSFVGGSVSMPIQPETESVENIKLQAVLPDIMGGVIGDYITDIVEVAGEGSFLGMGVPELIGVVTDVVASLRDDVYVNAKDMIGVKKIASNYSDADLTIMNLTSKGNSHVSEMTIGMEYTGNANTLWNASDLKVYFDQDYLTRNQSSQDGLYYELMNQASWDADTSPNRQLNLIDFPLTEVIFHVDGVRHSLNVRAEMAEGAVPKIDTYAKLVDLLNSKLASTYPDLVGKLEFQTDGTFTDQEGLRTGTIIELINTDAEISVTAPSIALDTERPAGNLYWDFGRLDEVVTNELVSINIDLEKVGLTGLGGELVIGSMNKGLDLNIWGFADSVTDTVSGIEEFNITVRGANDKSSWLEELRSTNNQLRQVNIVSEEVLGRTSFADLVIGTWDRDDGEPNPGLKDVLTLDATGFRGDLNVAAEITFEIVPKYLDNLTPLEDMPALGTADAEKAFFDYDGGFGDDYLDIEVDGEAVADSYASYDDTTFRTFNMTVNGNDGDDFIRVVLDDSPNWVSLEGEGVPEEVMIQSVAWSGVTISGGAGNDAIVLGEEDASNESTGWSYAVAFDQGVSHMANGADVIYNFSVGEQTFTREVQVLDFANPNNDGGNQPDAATNVVLHTGEWLNLVVEGRTYSYVATDDMTAEDIAALTAEDFVSNLSTATATLGDRTSTSVSLGGETIGGRAGMGFEFADGGLGQLIVIAPAKDFTGTDNGTQGEGDILTITSYVDHLDKDHHNSIEVSGVRLEGPVADTLVQGGYAQYGYDFLDFSSYNVKGVVWQNFDITGAVETIDGLNSGIITENGNALAAGNTLIYLRESQHVEGFYDIYHATVVTGATIDEEVVAGDSGVPVEPSDLFDIIDGAPEFLTGVTLIGTVQFVNEGVGTQQNFDGTNFLF